MLVARRQTEGLTRDGTTTTIALGSKLLQMYTGANAMHLSATVETMKTDQMSC